MVHPARGNRSPKRDHFSEIASPHSRPEAKKQYPTNTAIPKEGFSVTAGLMAASDQKWTSSVATSLLCKGSLGQPIREQQSLTPAGGADACAAGAAGGRGAGPSDRCAARADHRCARRDRRVTGKGSAHGPAGF